MFGTVRNCLNMATVSGYREASGIVAQFRGTMSGCINKGSISATNQFAGGICGVINIAGDNVIETIVENCYNTGSVTVNGGWTAGGISGAIQMYKDGDGRRCLVKNCYNLGEVSSNTGKSGQEGRLGGIVGFISNFVSDTNEVRNCYNLGIENRQVGRLMLEELLEVVMIVQKFLNVIMLPMSNRNIIV